VSAGFNFRGKAAILNKNFRNTRQILQAAFCIPATFPPRAEEKLEVGNPDYSIYEGGKPVAIECTVTNHVARIFDIVQRRRGARIAVVSENASLLGRVRRKAKVRGYRCFHLFRNEDLDLWKQQDGDALSASVVVSRMEAVKGFEFDTVIACDLSENVVPRKGTPRDEYWREAAVVYSALTRARDELILTFVGQPSVFVNAMNSEIEVCSALDEGRFMALLGLG
jgi:UvrD-like helicase C-terminal domain